MIRMLHFADFHLGIENYGKLDAQSSLNTRIRDFLRRIDEMIAYAQQHAVDLVIFAGDAFKNRQPNPTLQREFAFRIRDMARMCPVVLLVGNHDLPTIVQRASSLEIYDTLAVPNVIVGNDYMVHSVQTQHGPVEVATAPYPIRSTLLNIDGAMGKSFTELDALVQEQLTLVLRGLAQQVAQSPAPRVLTGHFTVQGAVPGSERGVMVGRDIHVPLAETANEVWDYVALGHIHKHQNLTSDLHGLPPTVYSGSLERIDFGEEHDPKGFCWVELERGQTAWRFVPVHARPFVTLRMDVTGSHEPTEAVLNALRHYDLQDAIVRMYIRADLASEARLKEGVIYEALAQAGVHSVAAIQREVQYEPRSRLGTNPEGETDLELLKRYFLAKKLPPEQIDVLLERAQTLFGEDEQL